MKRSFDSDSLTEPEQQQIANAVAALPASDQQGVDRGDQHIDTLREQLGEELCTRGGIYVIPKDFVLSVVIPIYNEVATVESVVSRMRETRMPLELILVDDGSTDGTRELLEKMEDDPELTIIMHEKNRGKGAALQTGFKAATGDVVAIQDADLEYDPFELRYLLQPIVEDRADVVYGSRFSGGDDSVSPFWHQLACGFLSKFCNLMTRLKFTDVETCYKLFRRDCIQEIAPGLRENRFGIEIEMTSKLSRRAKKRGTRFFERPISYDRRSYEEGKKIGWKDGVSAIRCIIRYGLFG